MGYRYRAIKPKFGSRRKAPVSIKRYTVLWTEVKFMVLIQPFLLYRYQELKPRFSVCSLSWHPTAPNTLRCFVSSLLDLGGDVPRGLEYLDTLEDYDWCQNMTYSCSLSKTLVKLSYVQYHIRKMICLYKSNILEDLSTKNLHY